MTARESVVRRYYDLVDDEAYEELFGLFTDDVVYERPGQPPIEGKRAFREFYLRDRSLDAGSHDLDRVVVDGDTAAVHGRFEGRQNGDPVAFGFADFHEFEGERIARRHTFTDRDAG